MKSKVVLRPSVVEGGLQTERRIVLRAEESEEVIGGNTAPVPVPVPSGKLLKVKRQR